MEKNISCPICRSDKIIFFCGKNGFKIYNCAFCRLAFVWPTPANLAEIYQASYYKRDASNGTDDKFGYTDYEEDKKAMRETFVIYLDKISRLTAGRKIFDVGAATGYFLDLARRAGWQTNGSEISEYAAKAAEGKGHKIFLGDLARMEHREKYDAVTMWDVLEHLADPKQYLKSAYSILNQGGLLAINTIDKSSCWARFSGKNWQAIMPPEHLFYYSDKSLKMLLEQNGFEILEKSKIGKKFTLSYICRVLAHSYNFKILLKLADFLNKGPWRKIYLPVNLRDNVFVIARKANAI